VTALQNLCSADPVAKKEAVLLAAMDDFLKGKCGDRLSMIMKQHVIVLVHINSTCLCELSDEIRVHTKDIENGLIVAKTVQTLHQILK
tara:strand:+ start:1115 stop:1378 length:264 start_codon:yes stop_codon:yes gene_type:complete